MYEEEDEEGELEDQEDEDDLDDEPDENQDQMDYYMQQHPELLLALDIAAFRRQQMQQRLHANRSADERQPNESTGRSGHSLFPQDQTNREDLGPVETDRQVPAAEPSPRVNLYANLAVEAEGGPTQNLGMSMGVNIGTYSYQNNRGNLLQQINYSRSQDGPDEREANELEDEEEDDVVPEENELECYIRNVNIDNSRLRAKTAPLRPMEHVEQFKMTPNFTNLEQAAVCAV